MLIRAKYADKAQSKNGVFLISGKNQVSDLDLSKKQITYITSMLEDTSYVLLNENGLITIVVKFDKLKDDKNKDSLRKVGARTFNALKELCSDLQIESASSDAIELFAEGLSLTS